MKFRVGWLVIIVLFIILGLCIYNFFNEGNNIREHINREFVLNIGDIAEIEDEFYVKLIKVNDERCKEDNCVNEGQKVVKIVIIKNPYVTIEEIGSLTQEEIAIKRTDYRLKLINISDSDSVTFKVIEK